MVLVVYVILLIVTYQLQKNQTHNALSIKSLYGDRVFFPIYDQSDQSIIFYTSGEQNGFRRFYPETSEIKTFGINISHPLELLWSSDLKSAIFSLKYYGYAFDENSPLYIPEKNDGDIAYYLIDLNTNQISQIGRNTISANFSANNQILFYEYNYSTNIDQLSICDINLKNCKTDKDYNLPEGISFVPLNSERTILYPKLTEKTNTTIYTINHSNLELSLLSDISGNDIGNLNENLIVYQDVDKENRCNLFDINNNKKIELKTICSKDNVWLNPDNKLSILNKNDKKIEFSSFNLNDNKILDFYSIEDKEIEIQKVIYGQPDKIYFLSKDTIYQASF